MDPMQAAAGAEMPEEDLAILPEEGSDLPAPAENQGVMAGLPVADWDYQQPRRGQIRSGVILSIGEQEIIVGLDAKRDGVVPFADMQRLGQEVLSRLSVGDRVDVYVLQPEDQDGSLVVSLFQAWQVRAWKRAQEVMEKGEIWEAPVVGFNKGGVVIPVGELRGFVPGSQIPGFPQGLEQEERLRRLAGMVGQTLRVKVVEMNRRNRRLILSALEAEKEWRQQQREQLMSRLREGEVRRGRVSSLSSFGAFVDLGGAEGLVHLSELSWQRVRHPKEVVRVGDEVEVIVLRLDHEHKRIGLSLKRLQPEPWARVEDLYELGQLVQGVVTNVVDFGAFAQVEEGLEGLIHVSELTDQPLSHPRDIVRRGDLLVLRIIRIDLRRRRLGLSLRRVLDGEWAEWAARVTAEAEAEPRTRGGRRTVRLTKPVPRPPEPAPEPRARVSAQEAVTEVEEPQYASDLEPPPVALEELEEAVEIWEPVEAAAEEPEAAPESPEPEEATLETEGPLPSGT